MDNARTYNESFYGLDIYSGLSQQVTNDKPSLYIKQETKHHNVTSHRYLNINHHEIINKTHKGWAHSAKYTYHMVSECLMPHESDCQYTHMIYLNHSG